MFIDTVKGFSLLFIPNSSINIIKCIVLIVATLTRVMDSIWEKLSHKGIGMKFVFVVLTFNAILLASISKIEHKNDILVYENNGWYQWPAEEVNRLKIPTPSYSWYRYFLSYRELET